jgi:hypothetical protein
MGIPTPLDELKHQLLPAYKGTNADVAAAVLSALFVGQTKTT